MLEKLTQDQEKILHDTREEWLNLFIQNIKDQKQIDQPALRDSIKWLYENYHHTPMPEIIYCDSYLICVLAITILMQPELKEEIASLNHVENSLKEKYIHNQHAIFFR